MCTVILIQYVYYIGETNFDESLFSARTRRKRQTPNIDHSPLFFDQLTFTDDQKRLCEDNLECLFDLAASGDMQVAMTTLNHGKDANLTLEILSKSMCNFMTLYVSHIINLYTLNCAENFPPNISANSTLRVTLGQESMLQVRVSDPGDNFTLNVLRGPTNSKLEKISAEDFVFRWTPLRVTFEPLMFIATDTKGAASVFTPKVEICACVNRGLCTLDGISSTNATIALNCICPQGLIRPCYEL